MSDVQVGNEPIKYVPLQSKRFMCAKCMAFVIEWTPVIKAGYGQQFYARMREARNRAIIAHKPWHNPFKVTLRCPNGCHKSPFWSFLDVATSRRKAFRPDPNAQKEPHGK